MNTLNHTADSTSTSEVVVLYVPVSTPDEGRSIGRTLLAERLCGCINIVPGMESWYWWQGELTSSQECVVIVKTAPHLIPVLTQRIRELHSYDTPCILALPVIAGNPDYITWLLENMRSV